MPKAVPEDGGGGDHGVGTRLINRSQAGEDAVTWGSQSNASSQAR
ncbi:hypothetical protein [Nonomuraea sp. NPDC050691]